MKIPEEKIQEVREAIDIVEVVSEYVTLKKRGKSFLGLCPFHTEKTPSFSVDPARGFYHCFGCGVGGNVFTFVMQMERVGFPEAVRALAKKAGISLPVYEEDEGRIKEIEILYHANEFALKFYGQCLHRTEEGKQALTYLGSRGFERRIVDDFQVGYAPSSWDGLLIRAGQDSIPVDNLKRAGLIVPRRDGEGYYDRFRGRIMFPVLSPSGRVVGFGGRAMKEADGIPKYLNSPETPIYQKSRILYGLFQSKTGIRREDRALLVEGYTDLMRLHQSGMDYGVATSGTALTQEQARLLFRYTRNVTLVFDGDSAGFNAALRGVDVVVEAGLRVTVAPLPRGSDPDSFLREKGRQAMDELLGAARTVVDFRLDRMEELGKLKTPGDRAAVARTVLETVVRIPDPLERNLMIKDVAERLGLEEAFLNRYVRRSRRGEVVEGGVKRRGQSARERAEQGLLKLLLQEGGVWGKRIFGHVEPDQFQEEKAQRLAGELYEGFLKGAMPGSTTLMDRYGDDPGMLQYLTQLLAEEMGEEVDRFQFGLDCLVELKQEALRVCIQEIREKMKLAQSRKEDVSEYSRVWMELKRQLRGLRGEVEGGWKKIVEI